MLHCTHWGMICPAETPEGHAVGLVKNLSLMSAVSVGVSHGTILEFLDDWGTEQLDMISCRDIANPRTTKIFVNGMYIMFDEFFSQHILLILSIILHMCTCISKLLLLLLFSIYNYCM